jgi:lipoprotein-anchoring transpeptidase ErfK/SrfK
VASRSFLFVAVLIGALIACSAAVYAYDSSREDKIAEGVTIGGIDVGGMTTVEARGAIREALAAPIEQPLTVRGHGHSYTLTPQDLRLRVDVEGTVRQALAKSRQGNVVSRTWRGLTGGEVNASLEPQITYSSRAVSSLVKTIQKDLNRPAKDAKVNFSGVGISQQPSKTGIAVRAKRLKKVIDQQITDRDGDRLVRIRTKVTQPKVSTDQLAEKYPIVVTVARGQFKLRLYRNLELSKTYRIAVGQVGLETPAGLYHVQNKAINPAWHVPDSDWAGKLAGKVIPGGRADNPLKARWLGIYNGAGIHGTDAVNSLGTAASHGCIRMAIPDVIELFDQVPVQAPVYIA